VDSRSAKSRRGRGSVGPRFHWRTGGVLSEFRFRVFVLHEVCDNTTADFLIGKPSDLCERDHLPSVFGDSDCTRPCTQGSRYRETRSSDFRRKDFRRVYCGEELPRELKSVDSSGPWETEGPGGATGLLGEGQGSTTAQTIELYFQHL
jgi:hypothetical protein